ncbi:hypothetical protein PPROV_000164700 [Pycnococcus provasolii]|uniref:Serine/threonine-protein kinase RIO1 n=1 Tax=Pycnococcus provasolii TaxID=41880 RepID=A0A830H8H2_9CHLO|nr:hypothetical protein PPROV_000164700 [Pycnococcus provasolii]
MAMPSLRVLAARYDENDSSSDAPDNSELLNVEIAEDVQLTSEINALALLVNASGGSASGDGDDDEGLIPPEGTHESDESDDSNDDYDADGHYADVLDWVDARDDWAARDGHATSSTSGGGSWAPSARRPNAHGGMYNKTRAIRDNQASNSKASASAASASASAQPRRNKAMGVSVHRHVNLDLLDAGERANKSAGGTLKQHEKAQEKRTKMSKDKADRATAEQVLDMRTRLILFKLLSSGRALQSIHGCVSTGKEANVYHAYAASGAPPLPPGAAGGAVPAAFEDRSTSLGAGRSLAVKVYKTSILVFRDRDRYVSGDFRFRRGYCKSNPRKMVKTWAEKEFRNLRRLFDGGISVPAPLLLRGHVLVMEFLGDADGFASPRLHDVHHLSSSRWRASYHSVLRAVRRMFVTCKLVHGDLSEYNLLYHEGETFVIDVSQSVDLDHPLAFDFLREDLSHVLSFYRRRAGIPTPPLRDAFAFVVDPSFGGGDFETEEACLEELDRRGVARWEGNSAEPANEADAPVDDAEIAVMRQLLQRVAHGESATVASDFTSAAADRDTAMQAEVEDRVFMQTHIVRRIEEVTSFERDNKRGDRDTELALAAMTTGMRPDLQGPRHVATLLEESRGGKEGNEEQEQEEEEDDDDDDDEEDDDNDDDDNDDDDDGDETGKVGSIRRCDVSKDEWKLIKAAAKAEAREKRKEKLPKHLKKSKTKRTGKGCKKK